MTSKAIDQNDPRIFARAGARGRPILRVIPLIALLVFGTMFIRHISALDGAAIWAAMTGLTFWQWGGALLFTAISFRAIGQYDVLVHRVLNTGQSSQNARAAGVKAIALSQTLGFGAVTSALVRWRCLSHMRPDVILRLSAVVSLSFLAGLAVITAVVVPISGLFPSSTAVFATGMAALLALAVLPRLAHRLGWIPAPVSGRTLLALIMATAADTAFAALALWVLWPDAIAFHLLFAAYLVALGAGLMSNAPAGLGAFDLTLLALLGMANDPDAVAALLAFRMIYYALPAGLALLGLLRSHPVRNETVPNHTEAALLHQDARIFHHPKAALLTLPCWGAGAVLGDLPEQTDVRDLHTRNQPVALYKCSADQAIQARRAGWAVLRCAHEASINPHTWTQHGAARRQLRRALNAFDASGLDIREVFDARALRPVARAWTTSHGREKGHSMGRFCPEYLRHQRVFAAFRGQSPLAFVSFHIGPVWTLDLMRHTDDIPNGTMHALMRVAIIAARDRGVTKLSLAGVPAPAPKVPFAAKINAHAAGLRRFKSTFAPNWQPRYICARGPLRLAVTMATLACRIHRPAALALPNRVHADDENYSFAPLARACEATSTADGASRHDHDIVQSSHQSSL